MTPTKLFLVLALVGACSKNTLTTTAPAVKDPVPMAEATPIAASPIASSMRTILVPYERVRTHLAADDLNGVADAAREIQATAKAAYADSKAIELMGIANSAGMLANAKDIEAARGAFGEISRHVIALLVSDKALSNGLHVFECPMVAGFKKWIQPTQDLQNPYMGKRMLACGGETSWN